MNIIVERDKEKAKKLFESTYGRNRELLLKYGYGGYYVLDRMKTKDFSSFDWIVVPKGYHAYNVRLLI